MSARRERLHRSLGTAIEIGLLGTVALAAFWLGGVTTAGRLAIEISAAALLFLTGVREWLSPGRPGLRLAARAAAPLALLAAIAFAQTVSLPSSLLRELAPGRASFEEEIRPREVGAAETAILSADPAETRSQATWLLCLGAFLLVAVRTASERRASRRLTYGLAGVAAAVALFAIGQLLLGNGKLLWMIDAPANSRPFGPFVNRNHFAGLMEIGLGAGFACLVVEAVRFVEDAAGASARARFASLGDRATAALTMSALGVLVMAGAVMLSQSRAGIAAAGFVSIVALGACLIAAGSRRVAVGLALAGVSAALALLLWIGPAHVLERFGDVPQANARIGVWKDCLRMAGNAPVLGTGLGTFASVYPAYQSVPVFLRFGNAESDWWQLLVEGGALSLAALAIGLPWLFGRLARAWKAARPSTRTRLLCLGASVTALLLHGFVDINLHIPANALAFSLAVGLLLGEASGVEEPGRSHA